MQGVVDLRAVGHQHERVDLGAQREPATGCGESVDDAEGAVRIDRHVHEEVDVADQIALAESVFRALGEEVLDARVLVAGVMAVAEGVGFLRAGSADGVVVATSSATIVIIGAPSWSRITDPVVRNRERCAAMVTCALYRTVVSAAP